MAGASKMNFFTFDSYVAMLVAEIDAGEHNSAGPDRAVEQTVRRLHGFAPRPAAYSIRASFSCELRR